MSLTATTQRLERQLNQLESVTMPILKKRAPKLDERPARDDLTSRELAKLLGGTIGAMCGMADVAEVRAAIEWWAEMPDDDWADLARAGQQQGRANPCGG